MKISIHPKKESTKQHSAKKDLYKLRFNLVFGFSEYGTCFRETSSFLRQSRHMLRCLTAAQWCPRGGPESSVEARKDAGFTEGQNLRIMCICIIQIPIKRLILVFILVKKKTSTSSS